MKIRAGILFIITGILIISWAFYIRLNTNHSQKVMMDEFAKAAQSYNSQQNSTSLIDNTSKKDSMANIEGMIGILEIPKINLKTAILDGVSTENLKKAVAHFKETPYPGEKGNCAISGHRSFTYNQFFNRLNEIENGDEILITSKIGSFKYIVYDKKIVDPEDVSVLNKTADATVTLITCHPEHSSAQRLIIKGRLASCATQ